MDSGVKYYTIVITSKNSIRYPGHYVQEEIAHKYLTNTGKPIRGVKKVYALPQDGYIELLKLDNARGSREDKLNKIKELAIKEW